MARREQNGGLEQQGEEACTHSEQMLLQKGDEGEPLQGVEEDTRWARQGRVCRVTYWANYARGEGVETTEEDEA